MGGEGERTGSQEQRPGGGKDTHICEWSLRALSFRVGGERTAGTQQQVTASSESFFSGGQGGKYGASCIQRDH